MSCIETGRIDKTPELRTGKNSGAHWTMFSLIGTSKSGKQFFKTIKVFGDHAAQVCDRFKAGDFVHAEGYHALEEWEYQGAQKHRMVLNAFHVYNPDKPQPGEDGVPEPEPPAVAKSATTPTDDIPF